MKRLYMIAGAAIALTACDNNIDDPVSGSEPIQISATIGESVPTRASDSDWSENDKIGITLYTGDSAKHVNMEYTTADGKGNFTGNPIYFYKPMALTAYYPFVGKEGEIPFTGKEGDTPGIITAVTSSENQTKQAEFDFLWAKQESYSVKDNKPLVTFEFSHKMSKLSLSFEDGAGADVSKIVSCRIDALILSGTFNTLTGECKADDLSESVRPEYIGFDLNEGETLPSLILFPQKPGNVTLHVYANELDDPDNLQHYSCQLNFGENGLESGKFYQFKITVSKAELNIDCKIQKWTEESTVLEGENGAISAD